MSTINCTQCKDKIWDYLEGTLSETEQWEMEKHLAECEDCKKEAREISAIMEGLHGLPLEELPKDYHKELMAKLEQEAKVVPFQKKTTHRWKPYSLIAAAVLVVAAVGGIGGIQNDKGAVLTAEKQPAAQREFTEPIEEQKQTEAKNVMLQEQKQELMPEPKVKEGVTNTQKDIVSTQQQQEPIPSSAEQVQTIAPQKEAGISLYAAPEQESVTVNGEDTPMPMRSHIQNTEQMSTVILTAADTKTALEQLHQMGKALGTWEENIGEDFIIFSMEADQTEVFYEKLWEIGEFNLPQKTNTFCERVLLKVVVKTK